MLFSILIAHYNNYDYFLDCYQSILSQSYQNFEVIIVDDCSTDNSFIKIEDLVKNDSRFKLNQNEINKGVGYTKRKCVELAKGEICGFLDPDDALTNNALEESLKAYSDKQIVASYSEFFLCNPKLEPQKKFNRTRYIKNNKKTFFNINFEVAHFFTFRKDAYEKTAGINETLTSSVDQDLYLKLYELGDFKFIQKPLYLYRLHEKGVSQDKSKKEKLNTNWHQVLLDSCKRRNIDKLYGKKVSEINNLQELIFSKENTFLKKILKKIFS